MRGRYDPDRPTARDSGPDDSEERPTMFAPLRSLVPGALAVALLCNLPGRADAYPPPWGPPAPAPSYPAVGAEIDLRTTQGVQLALATLGYNPGPIDGFYGPLTYLAVTKFQQDNGLIVDGIAGLQTRAQLHFRLYGY